MVLKVCICVPFRKCMCNLDFFPSFSDTKYCFSILRPTEYNLKKSLQSTFVNTKNETIFDEKYSIDLCCRFLYKCDAHKRHIIELNQKNTSEWIFWHCDCVRSFQTCLNNLNTKLSNEFAFIYSINTTKCFSNDHPIVKCNIFEENPESVKTFFELANLEEREKYFKRCKSYELDESVRKELQLFDIPFNNESSASGENYLNQNQVFDMIIIDRFDCHKNVVTQHLQLKHIVSFKVDS